MEATKRPWTVEGPKHEHYRASIMGADGHLIVNIGDGGNGRDVQLANADLIVRAVNTFDQARETLRAIIHAAGSRDGVGAKEIFQAREALSAMEATHE